MRITNAAVEKYIYAQLPKRDAVVAEMERYAAKHKVPIIGPAVARMLALFVKLTGATRIFEMGSAIGYSTLWMARAAGADAKVYYTDGDPKNAERAGGSFARAGIADRVEILVGDALDLLRQTPGEFDIIFNDVDKHQYPAAFELAIPRVRKGGLFITDNTLWSGRVTKTSKDRATRAVQEFNRLVRTSKDIFPVLIPLRDGVTVCRKL